MSYDAAKNRPSIKHRLYRLLRLFLHLQVSPRTATVKTLCRDLAVSRRTLFRDMKLLRELGVQISYSGRSNTYLIADIKLKRPAGKKEGDEG